MAPVKDPNHETGALPLPPEPPIVSDAGHSYLTPTGA